MHFYFVYLGMKSWWEKGCVVQLPHLSLSLIHSLTLSEHTDQVPVWRRETHTNTHSLTLSLNMSTQNYHLNKKDKNGLLCFIHLGKQQKKKNIVQTGILLTQTNHHTSVTLTVITKIFTSITNPICFFVVFVISFLGKCKSSSFFYNPFFNSFTFYINVKKMLNKRNINSVCLLRKDLLSDKVSTKGPPDFENLTAQPFTPPTCFTAPFQFRCTCTQIMCMYTHTRTHTHKQRKKKLFKSHLNKVH